MTVLDDVGRARGADDLYVVVSQSGSEYLVDARGGACSCPDAEYRDPEGGCKHARRVAYATGARAIPAWVDPDAADPDLGAHVDGAPRVATPDGGQLAAGGCDPDAEGEVPDAADARLAVHSVVCDLLAPRLAHLLCDFDAWMVTVEVAASGTTAACPEWA